MKSYVYHSATATAHALIEHLIAMMEREPEKTFICIQWGKYSFADV